MKIAVRAVGGVWQSVSEGKYDNEAHLRDLLFASPDLIPAEEIDPEAPSLKAAIREFGLPGSGRTDLVLLNEIGDIWLVECKLADNPEVRRKVIGQVLEYAAYLWDQSYEDFDRMCLDRAHKPLCDLMREALDTEALSEWSEEDFRAAVTANLRDGRFRLVIAVDAINSELKRTTEYLNAHPASGFTLHALEMSLFTNRDTELLIPRLHGSVAVSEVAKGRAQARGARCDRDSFLRHVEDSSLPPPVANRTTALLDLALDCGDDRSAWGSGSTPAFSCRLRVNGTLTSAFALWANGKLDLNRGQLRHFVEPAAMAAFVAAIKPLAGFEEFAEDRYLSLSLSDVLQTDKDAAVFKEALLHLREAVRRQNAGGD